ncbi:MAG TPA: DNA-3-methyladenine glycosylase [Thermoanaerobaculia bacterium]|nr:DNA-3-methyladenine glycosylase [Thermoanaerobaculia bacterium]
MPKPLSRAFFARSVLEVAPDLLGKLLVHDGCAGRIVEVEAYRQDDEASHSFRGPNERNRVMFGPPGRLYVYLSYGMHWCANAVCEPEGRGAAVLIRALEPVAGLDAMRARRPRARRDRDLCSGPAKLTAALAIGPEHYGADLRRGPGPRLVDDGTAPPRRPGRGPRVGISKAVDEPWRWWVEGNPHVSR